VPAVAHQTKPEQKGMGERHRHNRNGFYRTVLFRESFPLMNFDIGKT
jgi:hypothetical protein